MSTSTTHQQSLTNVGSETRPPMLERGSYIPWASRFRRYVNPKRENQKWLNKAIDEGPYAFHMFTPDDTTVQRMQNEDDLRGDELKYYEAEIEAMNLILMFIPKCTFINFELLHLLLKAMLEKTLVSVYNRFAQLMNDLERNDIIFPLVIVNTKFLNCLQPEWLKYVTQVHLAKRLTEDTFDDLFDYLQQNATPYYVTHPSSVVDYDDDYQKDVQTNYEDPPTSAMLLLAHAITQNFSNPTNNRLRTSSNTKNQEIVQGDKINIQSMNSGNNGRNTRRSTTNVQCYNCSEKGHYARNCSKPRVQDSKYFMEQMLLAKHDEAEVILTDEHNDFLFVDASRIEEIEELSANICLMAIIQPANNNSVAGPIYDSAFVSEVQSPSTSNINPLIADNQEQKCLNQPKIINSIIGDDQIDSNIIFDEPNGNVNSGSVEDDNNVHDSYALEQLARNAYKEAEKQQIFAKKVQQQNTMLTNQLELYKEKSQFIRDRDIIRDLEQQRDKLDLAVIELRRKDEELQKTQTILKRKMTENEDNYNDIVLDLEAKIKKNVNLMLKLGNSLQGMFMLGSKPLSVYDPKLKHGLGYPNPYTLKQAISQFPKLYHASSLNNSKIPLNVRDTEDIL
ncbi:retrovirus-related pol polyprotein from transposon TNT 1-94 [Tanacetum coccineum]